MTRAAGGVGGDRRSYRTTHRGGSLRTAGRGDRPGPRPGSGVPIADRLHQRYAYKFDGKQVTVVRKALTSGDCGIEYEGRLVASVERKSLADLVTSMTTGKRKFAIAELASLPRAALVIEDRYSQIFALTHIRPAVVADGLAEIQVRPCRS